MKYDEDEILEEPVGTVVEVTTMDILFKEREYMLFIMDNFHKIRLLMNQLQETDEIKAHKAFIDLMIVDAYEEYQLIEAQIRNVPSSEVIN